MTPPPDARAAGWPSATETLLLRAALWSGDEARTAWEAWRGAVRLDDVTPGSFRLLPQLYRSLDRLRVAAPELARLAGTARKAWVENQLWGPQLSAVLAALSAAGVPAVVLGGPALARYYPDGLGGRHTDDHEVLVPAAQAEAALAALAQTGWRTPLPPRHPPQHWRGPVRCVAAGGQTYVDFSPHLVWEANDQDAVDWWASAQAAPLAGGTMLTLTPAEQLLYLGVTGLRGNAIIPVRWAADAWWVIHTSGAALDWAKLAVLAAQLRVEPPLAAALDYLRAELRAPIPETAMAALRARTVTTREARFWRLNARPRGRLGELPVLWADYRRRVERGTAGGGPAGWVHFWQAAWDLARARDLPASAVRRLIRRA